MRVIDELLDDYIAGTTTGDRLEVNAWRDGVLLEAGLPVESWGIRWSTGQQVQGQLTVTVSDPDGRLAPRRVSDPLGPGGSQLELVWRSGVGDLECHLGWWRIREADPDESWLIRYNEAGDPEFVPSGGSSVTIQADELTCGASDLDRLDAETVQGSCLSEVVRLLDGITNGVTIDPAVTDKPIPAGTVYEAGRMDAVEDHLARCDAVWRMGPGGELQVLPRTGGIPVWTLVGSDFGVLVRFGYKLSDSGLYNAVTSKTADGGDQSPPKVARVYRDSGPLAWGGPFGRRPLFQDSTATTQAGVAADARALLASVADGGDVDLAVTCLFHPGLQLHDVVTVVPPRFRVATLTGRVTAMSCGGDSGVIRKTMELTVTVSHADLEALLYVAPVQ